jgi:hypothetical protein
MSIRADRFCDPDLTTLPYRALVLNTGYWPTHSSLVTSDIGIRRPTRGPEGPALPVTYTGCILRERSFLSETEFGKHGS